jgi:hypothetical protein
MTDTFTAQIDAWVLATKERQEAVFKESAQRVIAEMQKPVGSGGNMPVDTGFLRASMQATINAPASNIQSKPSGEARYSANDGETISVISNAKITDTIYAIYTANYAGYVNYGAQGRPARQFVGLAAQKWGQIVEQVTNEAKSRAG